MRFFRNARSFPTGKYYYLHIPSTSISYLCYYYTVNFRWSLYLVENVVGSIPAYTELTPLAQATVDTSGVTAATEKAGKEA
jgi:hypothetical protein